MAAGTIVKAYRGPASGLPTLEAGQLGWTTDTHILYVGTGTGNLAVLMASQATAAGLALMDDENAAAQLATLGAAAAADVAAKLAKAGDTMTGNLIMDNMDVTLVKLLTLHGEIDDGNSGTADTINWNAGTAHKSTLTGNVTFAFSGANPTTEVPTMTSNTAPSGEASEINSSADAYKAFKGAASDSVLLLADNEWIQYAFPVGVTKTPVGFSTEFYYGGYSHAPSSWKFQGSNNGTEWVDLDVRSGQDTSLHVLTQYTFVNTTPYRYFRFMSTGHPQYGVYIVRLDIEEGISDPAAPCFLTLKLVQDGTGGRTVTWPATVKGTPVINLAASATSNVLFYWDGTNYWTLNGKQFASATDKIIGRSTAGAGELEEIACTAAGRALLDDANAAAQRVTLGINTINVKDYGAVGDGTTDDTVALQAALTAVASGGKVIVPTGTYKYTTTLVIPAYASLEGYGYNSILLYAGTVSAVDVDTLGDLQNIQVKKYRTGAWVWAVATPVSGVRMIGSKARVENLYIYGFEKGLHFLGAGVGSAYNQVFLHGIQDCLYGIYMDATTVATVDGWVNENSIYGGTIALYSGYQDADWTTYSWGIYMDSQTAHVPNNNKFYGVSVEDMNQGIRLVGQNNIFYSPRVEIPGTIHWLVRDLAAGDAKENFILGLYGNWTLGTTFVVQDSDGVPKDNWGNNTLIAPGMDFVVQGDLWFRPNYRKTFIQYDAANEQLEFWSDTVNTAIFKAAGLTVPGLTIGGSVVTAAGRALIDDATAADQLDTLGALPKAGGTMSGDITLGENTAIALDPAGSADEKWSGITIAGTAGATLAVGDLCYLDVTAAEWLLTDANAAATAGSVVLGICILAGGNGEATKMLLLGTVRSAAFPASIALGAPVYVSTTAGDIQAAQPTGTNDVIRVVGWAVSAEPNTIYFCPSADYITHT